MVTGKLEQLHGLKAKVAELEQMIESARNSELAALPGRYRFASTSEFIAAVKLAIGEPRWHGGRLRGKPKLSGAKGRGRRRRRATINDETRAEVKKLVDGERQGTKSPRPRGFRFPASRMLRRPWDPKDTEEVILIDVAR